MPFSLFASHETDAVKILCENGNMQHEVASEKTIYANKGDHILYKVLEPTEGMLIISDSGKCEKYKKDIISNRVVLAIIKSYS
tara:strand:+ start:7626 stop:7874 length:249 start_codon:yes stop_codon:yes gene_type:complete